MKLTCAIVPILFLCMPAFADEPDIKHFRSCVEDLSSAASPTEPFSFQMTFPTSECSSLQIDLCWLGNGDFTLLFSESKSKIPVALFTRDKFLVIDVIAGNIVVGSGVAPSLEFAAKERNGESVLGFSFTFDNASDNAPAFHASLRSLLSTSLADHRLVRQDGGATLTWPSPSRRTLVTCDFENSQPPIFTGVRIYAEDDELHSISITEIKRGVSVLYTPFPDIKLLPLSTVEWSGESRLPSDPEIAHQILSCVSCIAALADRKCRDPSNFPTEVDWDLVQNRVDGIAVRLPLQLLPKNLGNAQK